MCKCVHTRLGIIFRAAVPALTSSQQTHMEVSAERAENKQSRGHQLLCLGQDSVLFVSSSVEQTSVRNTTLSTESPFNRTDVKKDQMVLMDNIHIRDSLECVRFHSLDNPTLHSDMFHSLVFLQTSKPFVFLITIVVLDLLPRPAHPSFLPCYVDRLPSDTSINGIDTLQTIYS